VCNESEDFELLAVQQYLICGSHEIWRERSAKGEEGGARKRELGKGEGNSHLESMERSQYRVQSTSLAEKIPPERMSISLYVHQKTAHGI
jgi:hypothetical protein